MLTNKETQQIISWILTVGTLLSAGLVLIGGIFYLMQNGADNAQAQLLNPTTIYRSLSSIWLAATQFQPLGIIAIGFIALVLTQVVRVGLLIIYYLSIKDYFFTLVCLFVFVTLLFGLFKQNG